MKLQLRPYQVEALARIAAAEERGVRKQLGVAACGLGKTIIFAALAQQRGGRTLILAHRDELIEQAAAKVLEVWPGAQVGVVKAERNEVRAQVVVASVQTLARPKRLAQLLAPFSDDQQLLGRADPFGLVVCDECFPAGTLVGGRPIESLRVGDLVPSWDDETGEACERPVVDVMSKTPNALVSVHLSDGESVTCTPNHPLMTRRGWVPAGALLLSDEVLSFTHHVSADRNDMHRVREPGDDCDQVQAGCLPRLGPDLLLGQLPGSLGLAGQLSADGSDKPQVRIEADAREQPDGPPRDASEDDCNAPGDGASAPPAWRQRHGADQASGAVGRALVLADGGDRPHTGEAGEGRAPEPLQDRHRERCGSGGRRDRRTVSFAAGPPSSRPSQGWVPQFRRVAGVEVHKPGSDGRFGGRCSDGAVYNIEVAGTHTYLVGSAGVVAHNCHHSAAESYRGIFDALRVGEPGCACGEAHERLATPEEVDAGCELGIAFDPCPGPPGPLLLGVTATPDRGDGRGLDDVFDEVTFVYDLLWGIRSGYLCDLRALRVKLEGLDLSGVKLSRGDYQAGDAGRALEDADAPSMIVAAWLEHALGRRTLVFTPTVALAAEVAAEFRRAGVKAGMVSGETPRDERRAILAAYSTGEIDVLASCAVLTEGFDEPRTNCVIMARPTKSRALFTQCIGRGTRRHPDKDDGCLILDVVGASEQHSLVTIPSLFGIEHPERIWDGGESLIAAIDHQEREMVAQGRLRAEEAELFAQLRTAIAWVPTHREGQPRRYVCQLGSDRPTVELAQSATSEERYEARVIPWRGRTDPQQPAKVLIADVALELAQGMAEDFARKHGVGALVDPEAAWRKRKPSPKQLIAAGKWRLPNTASYRTAGELSDAMTAHIDRKKAGKR